MSFKEAIIAIIISAGVYVNNQVQASVRPVPSLTILKSSNPKEIKSVLNDICTAIQSYIDPHLKPYLDNRMCNWDGRHESVTSILDLLYKLISPKLVRYPQFAAVFEVIEDRYIKGTDIRPIKFLAKLANDVTFQNNLMNITNTFVSIMENENYSEYSEHFILMINSVEDMQHHEIKRLASIVLNILEAYSQNDVFIKEVDVLFTRLPDEQQLQLFYAIVTYVTKLSRQRLLIPQSYNAPNYKPLMRKHKLSPRVLQNEKNMMFDHMLSILYHSN
ncbi:hypothetical protein GJ496_007263 [Pomphorhynchus laevis]|nr:hypothetical protein GJ496_007263 [Pomphorhynchus laevis]